MSFKNNYRLTWRGVKYSLFSKSNSGLYFGCIVIALLAYASIHYNLTALGYFFALASLVSFAALFLGSLMHYNTADANNKHALLANWAKSSSDAESERRWALLESGDLHSAFRQTGIAYEGPHFNVDGTPMLPGNMGLDVHGHMYGQSDLTTAMYDPNSMEWTNPGTAYTPPSGMDDNMGGGMGGMS